MADDDGVESGCFPARYPSWHDLSVDVRLVRSRDERMRGYRRVLETRDPMTSPERLRQLAVDPIRPVRLWAARNPNTPADALSLLAVDEDSSVRWTVIVNPGMPVEGLRLAAEMEAASRYGDQSFSLRERVVHHPNATDELRAELIRAGTCRCAEHCPKPWFYRNRFDEGHPSAAQMGSPANDRVYGHRALCDWWGQGSTGRHRP